MRSILGTTKTSLREHACFLGHALNPVVSSLGSCINVHDTSCSVNLCDCSHCRKTLGFDLGIAWKMPTKPNWAYGKMALTKNCVRALMCAGFPAIMSIPQPAISHLFHFFICWKNHQENCSLDLTQPLQDPSRWLLCPTISSTIQSHHLRFNSFYLCMSS